MVNWQVTATTIHCDAVDDEVTVMVYKDGTAKCTGYGKYGQPGRGMAGRLRKKGQQLPGGAKCEGPDCPRATAYRDKLFAEESSK